MTKPEILKQTGSILLQSGAREFESLRAEIMHDVDAVLASGDVVGGPAVSILERRLAKRAGRKHGVAVNSGTDALYFSLKASGISEDEVLVTDLSFIASGSCISKSGATPVFVDVDSSYNADLQRAEVMLSGKTRALIFVHLYGQMGDPRKIEDFATTHNLVLIEDAAQAMGSTFDGRPAGSIGQASCLSFNSTKTISAPGGGGMVLTDDDKLAEAIRRQRYHSRGPCGQFAEVGHNSLMPTIMAAVLNTKLDHDGEWIARRQKIAEYYREQFADMGDRVVLPETSATVAHNWHKFVIRSARREALHVFFAERGIETRVHYPLPLHREPCFAQYQFNDQDFPNATEYTQTVLTLPCHAFLSDGEVEAVVNAMRQFHMM